MIKVALIGSHGVGKTTICHELVSELKKRGKSVDYLVEIAREARKIGFKLNEDTTQDSQRWILHTQIARELEFGRREEVEVLVCDRSVLDNYVYFINRFGNDKTLDLVVNQHMKSYDFLFKFPINSSYLRGDSVRSTDVKFQKKINSMLEKELKERKIGFEKYKGIEKTIELIKKINK